MKSQDTKLVTDELYEKDLFKILNINKALATEKNFEFLISMIIQQTIQIVSADGGSIYVVENNKNESEGKNLRFKRSSLLVNSNEFLLPINNNSIAGYVALTGKALVLNDVYNLPEGMPFTFNSDLDKKYNYYTKSMLVIPMVNPLGEVMGVMQLVNKKQKNAGKLSKEEMMNGGVLPFDSRDFTLAHTLADQGAIALYNQKLIQDQKNLLESFIELIAQAIDAKSPYTGGHCKRVPVLTEMLAQAACESKEGIFANFNLNSEEWYELRIAAGLHDCGKIVTPVHIMDKSTKLEGIINGIELIKLRFELVRSNTREEYEKRISGIDKITEPSPSHRSVSMLEKEVHYKARLDEIDSMEAFIEKINYGGESLTADEKSRIQIIAKEKYKLNNTWHNLLTSDEVHKLSVERGTLTKDERLTINAHMVNTVKMLEALPFPPSLKRVPEYACGHHEKMDGTGYPRGIFGGDMSLPARMMAVADVFEALTAGDRPYKPAKKLSETMEIMGNMKRNNHLDPDVFDLFVKSKVYLDYAKTYLRPELIDFVDEEMLLKITPKQFDTMDVSIRKKRWSEFLPEYRKY